MITGNENLLQIAQQSDKFKRVFEQYGLNSYFKPENLEKIGRFTRLSTLLKSRNIELDPFLVVLNDILKEEDTQNNSLQSQENLHFAAMLPCGLRNPFKEFTETYLNEHAETFDKLNYLIEGNVNHELSYYPLLDSIKTEDELPDVIMASDINNFFHRPFTERFINTGVFETYTPFTPNTYLEKEGYADPDNHFTMYTANTLIMVVDKAMLGDRKMPETWEDLLAPEFENDIIIRGEDDFFCNAVMLPYFKDNGMDAIRALAKNIKSGLHPAEMVKLVGSSKPERGTVYVMPYFFSKRIKSQQAEVIWPTDGAIVSPVFLLVKKSKLEQNKQLLDFLLSEKTSDMLLDRYFPSINPNSCHDAFPDALKWLGWDFLKQHDIAQLKEDIRTEFMKIWNKK